jgi:hypothetical protein
MINTIKLSKELIEAGISTHGNCNSNGLVWDDDNNEIQDRNDVKIIIEAHRPTPDDNDLFLEGLINAGITSQKMVLALWNKVMQADPADADALQVLIEGVNSMFV